MANKKLFYTLTNRGLDPNINWPRSEILAIEKQTWYGVQGFTGLGHFQSDSNNQPAGLPTGSSTMTIAWGARWEGRPPSGSGNPIPIRFGNGTTVGWIFQELPVSRRLVWALGNAVLIASHSMSSAVNYTFAMTMTGGLATVYVNGITFATSSGRTYGVPNTATNPFLFGGSFGAAVPAVNWTLNFFTISGDVALTATEMSGWDRRIRQFGPQPLPSASNFWYAQDLITSGTDNHVTSPFWVDRIGGVGIERLSGSNLILRAYTPIIASGRWT